MMDNDTRRARRLARDMMDATDEILSESAEQTKAMLRMMMSQALMTVKQCRWHNGTIIAALRQANDAADEMVRALVDLQVALEGKVDRG